ncbi:hypothetical protein [Pseudoalteromonas sp. Of7M-16]|uniref:hypothetical protein n=1 Tax=Pseudoalteromonas sp. Of7M-16 TaxID=2917756 RepID=UPI001EF4887E|nr:hypothetical protein [Pseudoalteromonas sp. Of7M-16]MCG7551590.1 hypothetical protein [Pseudoalteromonas sp. Of7M-16]
MTSILYDHENALIACDSQTSENGVVINSNADKWRRLDDGSLLFATGETVDIYELAQHLNGDLLPLHIGNVKYFRVSESCEHVVYGYIHKKEDGSKVVREEPLLHSYGIGSGGNLALVALDCDLSAYDAVIKAAKFDSASNSNVKVYNVIENDWE